MPAPSSIQSYFSSSPTKNSDGFTTDEMQSALASTGATSAMAWTVMYFPKSCPAYSILTYQSLC
jgi:hypothetical protein